MPHPQRLPAARPTAIAVPAPQRFSATALWGSLLMAVMVTIAWLTLLSATPAAEPTAKEAELLAVLSSDADEGTKAVTCKQLAIYGSVTAVDPLEALMTNERLSSWARIALEAIPGPEASAALRRSTALLKGRELIGAINSLGVRGDADAVPLLRTRLSGGDAEVAGAAAAALGRIGGKAAVAGLRSRLASANETQRDAAAEACVVAATALLAANQAAEAAELAQAVRAAEVSEQRQAEGLRLAILAGGDEAATLLTESFYLPAKRLFAMAVTTARGMPQGSAADTALIAGVEGLLAGKGPDSRAVVLLSVLGDRGSDAAVPLVLRLAGESPLPVRIAALQAAGNLGNASVLEPLLEAVGDEEQAVATAARSSLASLTGEAIDAALLERLDSPDQAVLIAVIEAIRARQLDATSKLVSLVGHADEPVRIAALRGLGTVGNLDAMVVIIERVRSPGSSAEADAAKLALLEAAVRMPDRNSCAERIASALVAAEQAGEADLVLLETLAAVGGEQALATIRSAARSGARSLEDASTRLLGTWMTADAAPVLLELATVQDGAFRGRALRGYLRIARQFTMPDDERAAMCRAALAAATSDEERVLVVEILPRNPSAAMLEVAHEAEKLPGAAEAAKAAAAAIEAKLSAKAG
ncbi:MAG: HEAT repeat domain-containing protein [Pirellulales bacterium]